jgi:hypothetical protein
MRFPFRSISRFVAMAGIGGIAQTVSTDLLARLAKPGLTDADFAQLQKDAEEQGYVLEVAA